MSRHTSAFVTAGLAAVLGILSVPDAIFAQAEVDQPLPPYNPYQPGILPFDLECRVQFVRDLASDCFRQPRPMRNNLLLGETKFYKKPVAWGPRGATTCHLTKQFN
jgi:hypothetical protein